MRLPWPVVTFACASVVAAPSAVRAGDSLQFSGFAAIRGTTDAGVPLHAEAASAQLQAGVDWTPSPLFLAHLHLLARTDDGGSVHGQAGVPEAYVEAHLPVAGSRIRAKAGAFFLATSRENVDALWENPYAITSSALNSWFGEELRPIGLDLAWLRGGATLGVTVFRGNETFGALPLDPGWSLHDRWIVLGQKVPTQEERYASVSTENDGRLGWSARAGWSTSRLSLLYTHIDNRSDGLLHGDIDNWKTRFDVAGFDYRQGDWTLAGEAGWGPTEIYFPGGSFEADLRAAYLLVSRRMGRARATVRFDTYADGETSGDVVTLAAFFTPLPRLTLALELSAGDGEHRGLGDLRYRFAGP